MGYENCDVFFEDSKDNKYPDCEFCGDVSLPEDNITAIQIIRPNGSIERFVKEKATDWLGVRIGRRNYINREAKQDVK